jgi:hypothetical protein
MVEPRLKEVGAGLSQPLPPIMSLVNKGAASSLDRLCDHPTLLDLSAPGP